MAAATYPEAIRRVLLSEGGYSNHPADPGGPTNFGITLAVYRANGHPNATAYDVKLMLKADAEDIYRKRYAMPIAFDALPAGLDYALFDYAVNSGVGRPPKILRRVCGLPDSAPFADVLAALGKRDVDSVIVAVCDERLSFLRGLAIWGTFGAGWSRRVAGVRSNALRMTKAAAVSAEPRLKTVGPVSGGPNGKGMVTAPKTGKSLTTGGALVGAGLISTLWEAFAAHPYVSGAAVIIGGTAVAIGIHTAIKQWHSATFAARQEAPTPNLIPVPELKAA